MEQNTSPTIQVTASGKVVVTNAKDIVLLDGEGNPIAKRNRTALVFFMHTGGKIELKSKENLGATFSREL